MDGPLHLCLPGGRLVPPRVAPRAVHGGEFGGAVLLLLDEGPCPCFAYTCADRPQSQLEKTMSRLQATRPSTLPSYPLTPRWPRLQGWALLQERGSEFAVAATISFLVNLFCFLAIQHVSSTSFKVAGEKGVRRCCGSRLSQAEAGQGAKSSAL